jgi:hypothetical protein
MRLSSVFSATVYFMPHVYLLNVTLIAGVIFVGLRFLGRVISLPRPGILALLAISLVIIQASLVIPALATGSLYPTRSIADSYGPYTDMRPVSVGFARMNYECKPSSWWFPKGWRP